MIEDTMMTPCTLPDQLSDPSFEFWTIHERIQYCVDESWREKLSQVNDLDYYGNSALWYACVGHRKDVASALVTEFGCNINANGYRNKVPILMALLKNGCVIGAKIALDLGAMPVHGDHKTGRLSTLKLAICNGYHDIIAALLNNGESPDGDADDPIPPIALAIEHDDVSAVDLLCYYNVSSDCDVYCSVDGKPPSLMSLDEWAMIAHDNEAYREFRKYTTTKSSGDVISLE